MEKSLEKSGIQRESNIEMLRIIAMFMIVIFHICLHCVNFQLTDAASIQLLENGLFDKPTFFSKLFIVEAGLTLGTTGNAIFMLISGFFLVPKSEIKLINPAKKILTQLAFGAMLIIIASTIYYQVHSRFFTALQGIEILNVSSSWWFAGYYLGVIFVASFFLNRYLKNLSMAQYLTILVVLFSVISIGWLGGIFSGLSPNLRTFLAGVFLYCLGGFIKKFEPFQKIRSIIFVLIIILIFVFVWISYYNRTISNINIYHVTKSTAVFKQALIYHYDFAILPIVLGVSFFELGRRVKIPYSRTINFISSSAFMVYIIHENYFMRGIWRESDWITLLYYEPVKFCFKLIAWALAMYLLGIAAYLIYLMIQKMFSSKFFSKLIYKK